MNLTPPTDVPRRHASPGRLVGWALLGAGVTLAAIGVWRLRVDRPPTLTPERFQAARDLWQAAGPDDYEMTVEVTGREQVRYEVTVRGGVVESCYRNGAPLAQRRTWDVWSVVGLFDTIEADLAAIHRSAIDPANPQAAQLVLWCRFDPTYGFPSEYHRMELRSDYAAIWRVTQFEPSR